MFIDVFFVGNCFYMARSVTQGTQMDELGICNYMFIYWGEGVHDWPSGHL